MTTTGFSFRVGAAPTFVCEVNHLRNYSARVVNSGVVQKGDPMVSWYYRIVPVAAALMIGGIGCTTLSNVTSLNRGGNCEDSQVCEADDGSSSSSSYKPWGDRWSEEWYAMEADSPVGARQKYKHGKMWPTRPRPTGKQQQLSHRFHAAHYWPLPYVCQDRDYVRTVTRMQADNGWRDATTFYHYHFDEETMELNHAGQTHLRWLLIDVPHSHRVAWVQTAETPDISQQRLASLQSEAVRMTGSDSTLPIMLRPALAYGRPAIEVTTIRRAELGSIPAPRITYEPSGGGAAAP